MSSPTIQKFYNSLFENKPDLFFEIEPDQGYEELLDSEDQLAIIYTLRKLLERQTEEEADEAKQRYEYHLRKTHIVTPDLEEDDRDSFTILILNEEDYFKAYCSGSKYDEEDKESMALGLKAFTTKFVTTSYRQKYFCQETQQYAYNVLTVPRNIIDILFHERITENESTGEVVEHEEKMVVVIFPTLLDRYEEKLLKARK